MPLDLSSTLTIAPKILVIDAELGTADRLRNAFAGKDFQFQQVSNGQQVLLELHSGGFDLATLDLDIPGTNGLDLLRSIFRETSVPVIVVTAREPKLASVLCLELGADDYVLKPIDADQVVARIRAVLRRCAERPPGGFAEVSQSMATGIVEFSGWRFDPAGLNLWSAAGDLVPVTSTEAMVLRCLVLNARMVLSRNAINVYVHGAASSSDDRSIDGIVKKLRAKIATYAPQLKPIKSVRGAGYMFCLDVRSIA